MFLNVLALWFWYTDTFEVISPVLKISLERQMKEKMEVEGCQNNQAFNGEPRLHKSPLKGLLVVILNGKKIKWVFYQ